MPVTRRLTQLILQVTPCESDDGQGFRSKAPARPREPSAGKTVSNDGYDATKAYTNVTELQKAAGKANTTGTKPGLDPTGLWGRGYEHSEVREILPRVPAGVTYDEPMRAKYKEFQDKRRKGDRDVAYTNQWKDLYDSNLFSEAELDPFTDPPPPRAPLTNERDVVIIGAGLGGLLVAARLSIAGITDILNIEKGGDVGGTWYWNRYPGIACDVESYAYIPLLEECNYIPTMKYASGFEIQEHARRIAEKFKIYDEGHSLFSTNVDSTSWDEGQKRWIVRTNKNDAVRARHVVLANGVMTVPKLANIPGMDTYKGIAFHTSRWDYSYDLRGKTVGVIGTGATSCQCVPELAKVVKELYVFMRSPSPIDIRNNIRTSEEQMAKFKATPGWDKQRRANFDRFMNGGQDPPSPEQQRAAAARKGQRSPEEKAKRFAREEEGNFQAIQGIRMRVPEKVVDKPTDGSGRSIVEALTPWYPSGGKRPVFHDEYLPTFNMPHVHLVDSDGKGVEQITERGPVVLGKEFPVDVLVYATGFRFMATATFNTITGRVPNLTLAEKWATGTQTFIGTHVSGFPNMYIIAGPQGAGAFFNFVTGIEAQADYVVNLLKHMRDKAQADVVDIDARAEQVWVEHCRAADLEPRADRTGTISYYTQEGTKKPGDADYGGGMAFVEYADERELALNGRTKDPNSGPPLSTFPKFGCNPFIFS